jgi:hypothetical protein
MTEPVNNPARPTPRDPKPAMEKPIVSGPVWLHLLVLILAATVFTYPFLRSGLPHGDDGGVHVTYQHFFNAQIALGDPYPRWIFGLNGGLGSGIFFVQYPLPYYVAWGVGKITPFHWGPYFESRSLGIGVVLATFLAAVSTYFWCSRFADRLSAAAAALVYITLPYYLTVDGYMRNAVGEIWAISLLPLCLLFVELLRSRNRFALSGLALAFGALILSHLFTMILFVPILILYAICRGGRERLRTVTQTLVALAIGCTISGVYSFPVLMQFHYMHPLGLLVARGANYSPLSQMFTFNTFTYPLVSIWHRRAMVARALSLVVAAFIAVAWFRTRGRQQRIEGLLPAVLSILLLLVGAIAGHLPFTDEVRGAQLLDSQSLEHHAEIFVCTFLTIQAALLCYWVIRAPHRKGIANFFLVVALASYLMTTSWSQLIWKSFHFLWNIQFPWRLNAFLAVATAGLCALTFAELRVWPRTTRIVGVCVAVLLWSIVAVYSVRAGFYSRIDFAPVKFEHDRDGASPVYAQADPSAAFNLISPSDKKLHVNVMQGSGTASVVSISPRQFEVQADCESVCRLQVGQFYYPLWQAIASPGNVDVHFGPGFPAGLMELSLPPGNYLVRISMPLSWPERAGVWMSFFGLFIAAAWVIAEAIRRAAGRSRTVANAPQAA